MQPRSEDVFSTSATLVYCRKLVNIVLLLSQNYFVLQSFDSPVPYKSATFRSRTISVKSRDSSIDIVTRLLVERLRNPGSIPQKVKRYFSSCQCPDRLWDPPSRRHTGCQGFLHWAYSDSTTCNRLLQILCFRSLKYRDHGFESHSRHACLSFILCCPP